MKKALEILKHTYSAIEQLGIGHISTEYTEKDFLFLEEAIKELEELENRSCDSCICWDSVENSKLKTISYCRFLNTGTKNSFYCNEWENKHKITNF